MNPIFLEQRVLDYLRTLPAAMELNSVAVLSGAFPDLDLSKKTEDTQRLFQILRRSATGRLQAYVTRGEPYEVSGQTRRSFIWHTRPQVPSLPSPRGQEIREELDTLYLQGSLARIERKLDRISRMLEGMDPDDLNL